VEAIRSCGEFLGPHGGHRKAAGFTIEESKISLVRQKLIELAQQKLDEKNLKPTLMVDLELSLKDLSLDLYDQLAALTPFGEGNPQPVFATRDVQIADAWLVGNGSQHLKLNVKCQTRLPDGQVSNVKFDAIAFNMGGLYNQISPEKPIDIAYNLVADEWNGKRRLQLKLKDIKIKNE